MKAIKFLLSGVLVYFLVATIHACSAGDSVIFWESHATASGSGTGGAPIATTASGHGGGKSSGGGSVMNPVDDAQAESGSRLKARRIVADDGAKDAAGFYDSARKEPCGFVIMSDGQRHCVPLTRAIGIGNNFSDSACTVAVASSTPPTPLDCTDTLYPYDAAYVFASGMSGNCGYRFYQPIQVPEPPAVYFRTGSSCILVSKQPGLTYFIAGPEIPPSAFVAASIVTDP